MFDQKRNLPVSCDKFIELYDACNIGCEMCKFNQNIKEVNKLKIDFNNFKNIKVLFSYRTEPYMFDDFNLIEKTIKKLHDNKCSIVFLTRKSQSLIKQLKLFNSTDFVGVSISENSSKNSNLSDIIELFKKAKELNLKTWLSLEPVLSFEFANKIINATYDFVDFYRVGKDDLILYDWRKLRKKIIKSQKIFIK